MTLAEFYPLIRSVHVALVATSGLLFAVRGIAALAGQAWPSRTTLRLMSVIIDTALLAAGIALWLLLGLHPVRDAWLATKFLLLAAYIVLGTLALRRARTRGGRAAAFTAALACYLFMVSVAMARHPLGALRTWLG